MSEEREEKGGSEKERILERIKRRREFRKEKTPLESRVLRLISAYKSRRQAIKIVEREKE